jgi:uncharacterized protein (TIGR00296 family)
MEGEYLVHLARNAIVKYLKTHEEISLPPEIPSLLNRKSGVFVTLNDLQNVPSLRGCIGYPTPKKHLIEATIRSAIESATADPRFSPLTLEEFENHIVVEVSVLTPLSLIDVEAPREYVKQIKVGRDGLVIERGFSRGLLLPQVPIQYAWDEEEFISNCCIKAGLSPDAWLLGDTKIYKYQAVVFEEKSPRGRIEVKSLIPKEIK